jgi:hypothetical protein
VNDGNGSVITNLAGATITLAANNSAGAYANWGGAHTIYNAGQVTVAGTGGATINDTFNNSGTLNLQGGALSLTGAYSLTNGTLNFGITNTSSFGKLNLSGNAGLTGALGVTFYGYTPQVGDSFGLITYGLETTGAFTAFNLPSGFNWQENYRATLFTLSVASIAGPTNVTLMLGQPVFTPNGFNLLVSGPVTSNYMVQVSTNLANNSWATWTNYVSTAILTSITDSVATNFYTNRFYRAFIQ